MATSRLARHHVAIWYCDTEAVVADELAHLERRLSTDERMRRDRFVFARDRHDFTVAHGLARGALSYYVDRAPDEWRFRTDSFGKPAIVEPQAGMPPLTFNLSHTRGRAACAIALDTRLGIDIERIERVTEFEEVAGRFFSPTEVSMLNACAPDEHGTRFLELWTLKEAYVKAIGRGMSLPFDSFAMSFEEDRINFAPPPDEGTGWNFLLAEPPAGGRIAVAVQSAQGEPWGVSMHEASGRLCSAWQPLRRYGSWHL
jgi:4'-phosphopantetheinyl transferase